MSKPITGRAIIYVDGATIPTENGAKLNPGGENKTPERHGGTTYYRAEEVSPTVECTVLHTADIDILKLSAIEGATVMFETNTGQKFLLRGAVAESPVDLDAGSGKSALKLFANECVKL